MSVIFVRFVASSMDAMHFPVEISWAVDGGEVEAHILAPTGDMTKWSFVAQVVHALSLDYLIREGRPTDEVAARTLEVLGAPGAVVVSDNPRWEQPWIDRLLAAAGHSVHGIVVGDAADIYAAEARRLLELAPPIEEADDIIADCRRAETRLRRVRYRAGPDAEGERWILDEIRRRVNARLGFR